MPTYQYVCTSCEQPLEVVQGFNDDRLTVCPACGERLRQVFSAVGVVFKGSGFYRNDSRGSKATSDGGAAPKAEPAAATASSDSTSSSAASSSSTPAAAPSTAAPAPAAKPKGDGKVA